MTIAVIPTLMFALIVNGAFSIQVFRDRASLGESYVPRVVNAAIFPTVQVFTTLDLGVARVWPMHLALGVVLGSTLAASGGHPGLLFAWQLADEVGADPRLRHLRVRVVTAFLASAAACALALWVSWK